MDPFDFQGLDHPLAEKAFEAMQCSYLPFVSKGDIVLWHNPAFGVFKVTVEAGDTNETKLVGHYGRLRDAVDWFNRSIVTEGAQDKPMYTKDYNSPSGPRWVKHEE